MGMGDVFCKKKNPEGITLGSYFRGATMEGGFSFNILRAVIWYVVLLSNPLFNPVVQNNPLVLPKGQVPLSFLGCKFF